MILQERSLIERCVPGNAKSFSSNGTANTSVPPHLRAGHNIGPALDLNELIWPTDLSHIFNGASPASISVFLSHNKHASAGNH